MQYKRLTTALIALAVLCLSSCASSRTMTQKMRSSTERDSIWVSNVVTVHDTCFISQLDTLRETVLTTILLDDNGDTIKQRTDHFRDHYADSRRLSSSFHTNDLHSYASKRDSAVSLQTASEQPRSRCVPAKRFWLCWGILTMGVLWLLRPVLKRRL